MYKRLFTQILDSSVWVETPATKVVWLTLLLVSDHQTGFARFASIKNLAQRAVVTVKEAVEAVKILCDPDPDSSNPANEGRRIEKVPGGYLILNHAMYREIKDKEMEREQTRVRVANYKKRKKEGNGKSVTEPLPGVTGALLPTSTSTSTSSLKGKRIVKGKGKKTSARLETLFSESEVAEWEVFRARLDDWAEEHARYYYELFQRKEAMTPSKYRYADWIRAAREWDKRDPNEWRIKHKAPLLGLEEGFKQLNNHTQTQKPKKEK